MSRWDNLKGSNKYFFPYTTYYDDSGNKYKTGASYFMNPYYANQILRQPRQYNPLPSWVRDPTPTPSPTPTPFPTVTPTPFPTPTATPWATPTITPFPTMSNIPSSSPNQKLYTNSILSNEIPKNFKLLEFDVLEHDFNDYFSNWFNNWNGKQYFNVSDINQVMLNSISHININPNLLVHIESDDISILETFNYISFTPYLNYQYPSTSVIYLTLAKITQNPDPVIESITYQIDSSTNLSIIINDTIQVFASLTIYN